jgi:NAD(P)-dependent dehydrogenase (short-subunit alcohol dehydrogenase family)
MISISSTVGLVSFEFGTAYAASKFALEGWMAPLHPEVAPFGISTTVVKPGVLPHGTPHGAIDKLRRADHRGLCGAQSKATRILESPEWPTIRRPGEAPARASHHCKPRTTAAPLYRWCRCRRHSGTSDRRFERADRRSPRPVDLACVR